MNFIQLVGRVTQMPTPLPKKDNVVYSEMKLEVEQNFRAIRGEIRYDVFPIRLWRGASEEIVDRCKEGRLLGIKGRLELHDGQFCVIAEHVEHLRP